MKYYVKIEGNAEFTIDNVSYIDVRNDVYFAFDEEENIVFTSPLEKTSYIVLNLD